MEIAKPAAVADKTVRRARVSRARHILYNKLPIECISTVILSKIKKSKKNQKTLKKMLDFIFPNVVI